MFSQLIDDYVHEESALIESKEADLLNFKQANQKL